MKFSLNSPVKCFPSALKSALVLCALIVVSGCDKNEELEVSVPRTVLTEKISTNNNRAEKLYAGKLRASKRATLSFEANGIVSAVTPELGDTFAKGDLLAQIDDSKLQINLKSRLAELHNAQANLKDAELEYQRKLAVKESGAISDLVLDQAETRLEGAKAQVEAAIAGKQSVEKQISDLSLVAPFSGEVTARLIEPNQVVSAGQPILEVAGLKESMEGVVHVPVTVRQSLKLGERVTMRVLSSEDFFEVAVTEIGNQANNAGLFPITIMSGSSLENVNAGQSIEVNFGHQNLDVLIIPNTAYGLSANGDAFVYLFDNDKVVQKAVEIGAITKQGVEVLKGLSAGDEIVVKGVDLLSDGEHVIAVDDSIKRFGN